ncbi:hypothetical protein FACS1894161_1290 [Spirochaetia bacterium]|nr:hypothetical protein FACS1894161_1290 [Spirochaetia bacterium]
MDGLFNTPPEQNEGQTGVETTGEDDVLSGTVKKTRVTMDASYRFRAGISPGWTEAIWYDYTNQKSRYYYVLGTKMEALLSLDFQIMENLRVWNSFTFSIPSDSSIFTVNEFYFDYNLENFVFLRAGQYETGWGISPNFPYTNLPARIPGEVNTGRAYMAKIDFPIGIGGLQFLVMTRPGFMKDKNIPTLNEIAYGVKFNAAFPTVDIDMGMFYFKKMPLRFFSSLKTTLRNTELYAEALASTPYETMDDVRFAVSAGFVQDFFGGKLTLNGEMFYNGEDTSWWYQANNEIDEEEEKALLQDWNFAGSFIIRPGVLGLRLFCQVMYSYKQESAMIVPGISIKPGDLITTSLIANMVAGSRAGYYYRNNSDRDNRPFSISLLIHLGGSFRYTRLMDRN